MNYAHMFEVGEHVETIERTVSDDVYREYSPLNYYYYYYKYSCWKIAKDENNNKQFIAIHARICIYVFVFLDRFATCGNSRKKKEEPNEKQERIVANVYSSRHRLVFGIIAVSGITGRRERERERTTQTIVISM